MFVSAITFIGFLTDFFFRFFESAWYFSCVKCSCKFKVRE